MKLFLLAFVVYTKKGRSQIVALLKGNELIGFRAQWHL